MKVRTEPGVRVDDLARQVIGAAIEVHRTLGPGLLESVYENALCVELHHRGVPFARQASVQVIYRGQPVGDLRLDLLVGGCLIVELKAVESLEPIHTAQVLTYLRATGHRLALLLNFNEISLRRGIRRIVHS